MPFIAFLYLIIFVCLLMGDDGFKIMGIGLTGAVVLTMIFRCINDYVKRKKREKGRAEHREKLGLDD